MPAYICIYRNTIILYPSSDQFGNGRYFSSTFPLVSDGDFDDSRFNVVILGNLISLLLLLSSLIVNFFKLVIEEFGEV